MLALLGDSVTTDYISSTGHVKTNNLAGRYLPQYGVEIDEFNSYSGSRWGHYEVMLHVYMCKEWILFFKGLLKQYDYFVF